jgi:hypothetical protein
MFGGFDLIHLRLPPTLIGEKPRIGQMSDMMSDLPQAETADPDGVQVALRAAQTLWSRGDTTESLRWLRRAAESASDEGADLRSFQLAKAAAELRGKLFGSSEAPSPRTAAAAEDANVGQRSPSEPVEGDTSAVASSTPASEVTRAPWSDESPSPVVTATQYPSQRPRQLMGLSSSTLETTVREPPYSSVPSWSADSERRVSSAPPPLPHAQVEEYEELEAEPDEEAAEALDRRRAPTLPPAAYRSSVPIPPPLPAAAAAFHEDDGDAMRPELPTVLIPPENDAPSDLGSQLVNGGPRDPGTPSWNSESSGAWGSDPRASGWSAGDSRGSDAPAQLSELAQAKLTARVHHQAVRVSFAPDVRAPGQYVVRPLRAGEAAPAGERVALLVALEPGIPLV